MRLSQQQAASLTQTAILLSALAAIQLGKAHAREQREYERQQAKRKIKEYYHVRTPCGATIDWLEVQNKAVELAKENSAHVYHVKHGRATRIY